MKVGPKSSLRPFLHRALQLFTGADPEISERGGRKPNSRKRGPEFNFSVPLLVIFL